MMTLPRRMYHATESILNHVRVGILRLVFKRIGRNFLLGRRIIFSSPQNIDIGDNVFINAGCILHGEGGLTIGDDTLIGPYTTIWTSNHNFADARVPIREQGHSCAPVKIDRDVWIGALVTIVAGVTIGEGSVVGANAVVTKDVPSFSVVAGNPARVIRLRHP